MESSKDGEDSLVSAAFGLGMAGAEYIGMVPKRCWELAIRDDGVVQCLRFQECG